MYVVPGEERMLINWLRLTEILTWQEAGDGDLCPVAEMRTGPGHHVTLHHLASLRQGQLPKHLGHRLVLSHRARNLQIKM